MTAIHWGRPKKRCFVGGQLVKSAHKKNRPRIPRTVGEDRIELYR